MYALGQMNREWSMKTDIYTNRPGAGDFTLNYFYRYAAGVRAAQLACPFFSDATPVQILRQAGCSKIQLLVRLCESTSPDALVAARSLSGVDIRYYTSRAFHAKFYVLGERALIGSANLTNSGMTSNRELSIVLEASDPRFDELVGYFDELWSAPPAAVLTPDALSKFQDWYKEAVKLKPPPLAGVPAAAPINIDVKSQNISSARTYLESFRVAYYETLIPNHRLVRELYREHGARHVAFEGLPEAYEIDRFLFWAKGLTTDEDLEQNPVRSGDDLSENIRRHVNDWFAIGEVNIDHTRLARIAGLQALFDDEEKLAAIGIDEITDMLVGCAAFEEMLRFTKGGLDNHLAAFKRDNTIQAIRMTFEYLVFGSGDFVQQIYDCIYMPKYKLAHWGRNCTLELFGWINHQDAPPFNGRTIKALRYLGFDVVV
jgi:hypothetical protein